MSAYYRDEAPARDRSSRHYYREERRDDRDPRYVEREEYLRAPGGTTYSRELVPRPHQDAELSVEEIRRDFPPPGYRARSADPGYYRDYDDRRSAYDDRYDREYDRERRSRKKTTSSVYVEEERRQKRTLDKQQKIFAAVAGAALAVGGKELYDRREANQDGTDVHRNVLLSAALGAGGALAGYQGAEFYNKHTTKDEKSKTEIVHRGRDGKVERLEYYSDDDRDPKSKKGNKNFLESALAAAGLGGAVKALTGGGGDDRDRKSDAGTNRSRSKSRDGDGKSKIQKAAMASLIAGATEAFRVAKEPGGWKGEKAKRVITAAAGAGTIDAAQKAGHGKLGLMESVVGGLVGNRVLHGSKNDIVEDRRTGRSRSRSRARSEGGGSGLTGPMGALAAAGLGAFGAKKAVDAYRERSQSRGRGRSADSYDSRGDSPRRRERSRSRSVVDKLRSGAARLGIGNGPDDDYSEPSRSRKRRDSRSRYSDDGYSDDGRSFRSGRDRYYDDDYDRAPARRQRSRSASRRKSFGSESDLGDSDEDEKRAKKMKGKQILTTGLAAVATIHAAHNVYQSMEKRNARHKAVKQGRLSPEEAKKLKTKAIMQDAASVGIAAMGIKGAISELKEAREQTNECKEWEMERAKRHQKRLQRLNQRRQGSSRGDSSSDYSRSRADDYYSTAPPRTERYDDGPRYIDGNPYSASLPAPPVYDRR